MSKTLQPSGEVLFEGATINEFASGYNYAQAKFAGVSAVVLRATAGADYVDARFSGAAQRVQQAGMRLGFYHYLMAENEEEARAQARFFTTTIHPYAADLRASMRFDALEGLDFESANRIALAFLDEVERATGVAPAVYTDAQSANLLWNRSVAERYPLWVIDTQSADAPDAGDSPWKAWVGWQYADSVDPACGCAGTPISRFTAAMLAKQIVLPESPSDEKNTKLICVTVAPGDTLGGIARLFNTGVKEIVRLNGIANPNRIFPGQRLYLRVAQSVPYPCCDAYTVRRGDTLTGIGARFDVDWRKLASINEIPNPNRVQAGAIIKLGVCDAAKSEAE